MFPFFKLLHTCTFSKLLIKVIGSCLTLVNICPSNKIVRVLLVLSKREGLENWV